MADPLVTRSGSVSGSLHRIVSCDENGTALRRLAELLASSSSAPSVAVVEEAVEASSSVWSVAFGTSGEPRDVLFLGALPPSSDAELDGHRTVVGECENESIIRLRAEAHGRMLVSSSLSDLRSAMRAWRCEWCTPPSVPLCALLDYQSVNAFAAHLASLRELRKSAPTSTVEQRDDAESEFTLVY